MENLPSLGGPAQCHVTFVQRFDFGGIIPKWIITKMLPKQLEVLENAMDEFMQDEKMDGWKLREVRQSTARTKPAARSEAAS